MAATHFASLFTAASYCLHEELFTSPPKSVSSEENDLLTYLPSIQDIRDAVSSLLSDSATGVDGFAGY